MKKRTRAAGAALLLLAFAAVTFWISNRNPTAPVTANVTSPGPAAPAPAAPAIPEAPADPPAAATAGSGEKEPAGSNVPPGAPPATRSSKTPHALAKNIAAAKPESEPPARDSEPGEKVAAAKPAPAEPPPKDPSPAPEAKPPQKPADGSALGSFQNRVGPSFSLARVVCQIDGQTVYSGPGGKNLTLFQRDLAPGTHSVSVTAEYRGNSAGVFSYAQGYRFKVSSGRRFNVVSGKPVQVSITGYEKGGPTEDFGERLALAVSAR
jgi:hypothetical protein